MTRDLISTVAGPKGQPQLRRIPCTKYGMPIFSSYRDTPVRRMLILAYTINNQLKIERNINLHLENRRLLKESREILDRVGIGIGKYKEKLNKGFLDLNNLRGNEIESFKASSNEIQQKIDKKFPTVKPSQPELQPYQKDFLMKFFNQLFALVNQAFSLMGRIFTSILS